MAFTITCGVTSAEKRALDKTMSSVFSATATLRNESSVVDPVVLIEADAGNLAACNYMHIGEFGRYYFITDVIAVSNKLCEVHGHCDVLHTYASAIRKNQGIIGRTSTTSLQNFYVNDPMIKLSSKKKITIKKFDNDFIGNDCFMLVTLG